MKNYVIRKTGGNGLGLFDEAFEDFFKPAFWNTDSGVMKTDIVENENSYEIEIELPGFKKEEIEVTLNDGYLTVSAEKKEMEEGKKGNYLRRERAVSASRSYYVGDVAQESIGAKYDSGVLSLNIPKEAPKKPERKLISIQ